MDIILALEMDTLSSEMDKYLNNQHATKGFKFLSDSSYKIFILPTCTEG